MSIYLLNPDVLSQCCCVICFTAEIPVDDCDDQELNDLKNTSGRLITMPGTSVQITPGVEYAVLVTEKINNIELPKYSKKIVFNEKDKQPVLLNF